MLARFSLDTIRSGRYDTNMMTQPKQPRAGQGDWPRAFAVAAFFFVLGAVVIGLIVAALK
jgi:hypothetical protein